MNPRHKSIANRWFNIVVIGITAGVLWALIAPSLEPSLAFAVQVLSRFSIFAFLFVSVWISAVLVSCFGWGRWAGFFGFKNLFAYPPLWLAVIIGIISWSALYEHWVAVGTLFGVMIVTVISSMTLWRMKDRTRSRRRKSPDASKVEVAPVSSSRPLEYEDLMGWIMDGDCPICEPQQDLFGHDLVACRIVKRLLNCPDGEAPTMALVGGLGSGKSSIRELVDYRLRQIDGVADEVVVVNLTMWPFDSPEAAVRGILNKLTSELSKHVNTLALTGVADSYVRAIEKTSGFLGSVSHFLSGPSQPTDALKGIVDVARAIDLRIVLWIEDVERFAGADRLSGDAAQLRNAERVGPIRALLFELDACPKISVIISDGSLESRFDAGKIARFIERPPKVRVGDAWKLIHALRSRCLRKDDADLIDPAAPQIRESLNVPKSDMYEPLLTYRVDPEKPTLQESIALLLHSPRSLKSALRLCHETWEILKGEIDFDDVLLMSVLRESRPRVFSVVDEGIRGFQNGFGSPLPGPHGKKPEDHPVMKKLDLVLQEESDVAIKNAILEILGFVFPNYADERQTVVVDRRHVDKPQGLAINHPTDYWQRYIATIPVDDVDSDQAALREISEWKREKPNRLLDRLFSENTDSQIESFAGLFSGAELCRLLEELTDRVMPLSAEDWHEGSRAPGVASLWQMIRVRYPETETLMRAVTASISKAIRANLPLASDLYYFFCSRERDVPDRLSSEELSEIRKMYLATMLEAFPPGNGRGLIQAMKGGSPYVIGWLCWTLERIRANDRDGIPFSRWNEFAPVMIEAAELEPSTFLPQFLLFITTSGERRNVPPSADSHRSSRELVYHFDETAARRLFRDDYDKVLSLFAATETPSSLLPQAIPMFDAVRSFIEVES
ncbi:MAG: hypothetical protein IID44_06185 [Planctomycetes bacterium]|nr:hypothetical protein [Planctomycetota bacterium]